MKNLLYYQNSYENKESNNDFIWEHFKDLVNETPFLKSHRDYVEDNFAGFGDRSFHYMWYLLLQDLKNLNREVSCLEIGIFKGQVISLWALIAKEINLNIKITGISPLEGNYPDIKIFRNHYIKKLLSLFIPKIRKDFKNGNLHVKEDFIAHIDKMFQDSNLDFKEVELIKGYSNDPKVIEQIQNRTFDMIYIDGDHSFKVCKEDLNNYAHLLLPNGYLIMDDAASFLPGTKFFKGILEVSKVCEEIDSNQFKNILNVGHNRVYQKIG